MSTSSILPTDSFSSLIEVRTGDVPIIIAVPHGGGRKSYTREKNGKGGEYNSKNIEKNNSKNIEKNNNNNIEKNNNNNIEKNNNIESVSFIERINENACKIQDSYTIETCYKIISQFKLKYSKTPYIIISHLHRSILDLNRAKLDAGETEIPLLIYDQYHQAINNAKDEILKIYGNGLFIDLHGQSHDIHSQIGILLRKNDLETNDFNTLVPKSSISYLISQSSHSPKDCINGNASMGTLFEKYGFPATPSLSCPIPLEMYFNGGYNTKTYGSFNNLGKIDAIQIELAIKARTEDIDKFSVDFVDLLIEFFTLHYPYLAKYFL